MQPRPAFQWSACAPQLVSILYIAPVNRFVTWGNAVAMSWESTTGQAIFLAVWVVCSLEGNTKGFGMGNCVCLGYRSPELLQDCCGIVLPVPLPGALMCLRCAFGGPLALLLISNSCGRGDFFAT